MGVYHFYVGRDSLRKMKYIAIDYGTKRVGIALSDEGGQLAFPKDILKNDKDLIPNLLRIIESEDVHNIVIGASFDKDGNPNSVMAHIEKFKPALEAKCQIPIYFEKEHMTSVHARNFRDEIMDNGRRKTKTDNKIDASAAALILQRFLDREKMKNIIQ